jgi:hypothetical protein
MKYRVVVSILLVALLGGLAAIFERPANTAPTQSQGGADDAALKSLTIN